MITGGFCLIYSQICEGIQWSPVDLASFYCRISPFVTKQWVIFDCLFPDMKVDNAMMFELVCLQYFNISYYWKHVIQVITICIEAYRIPEYLFRKFIKKNIRWLFKAQIYLFRKCTYTTQSTFWQDIWQCWYFYSNVGGLCRKSGVWSAWK